MEEQKHYLSYAAEEIDRRLKKVDDIPTKTSELVNNSGYLTKVDADKIYQTKGNYALEDDIPEVPTKVGELENDKGYITLAQVPSVDLSEYAKTSDIPTVPTRVSAFENDALYLKEGDIDLTPYAKKSEIKETYQPKGDYATKEEVNSKQDKLIEGEGISIEGNVISCVHDKTLYKVVTELPEVGEEHKIYLIVSTEQEENNLYNEWAYINGAWEMLGTYKATIDLEPYALKEDIPTKVSELENDSNFATSEDMPTLMFDTYKKFASECGKNGYNETQYKKAQCFLYEPFMINAAAGSTTNIPTSFLNDSGTGFFVDYYWKYAFLTGGIPIKTVNWDNQGRPSKLAPIYDATQTYTINFTSKTITRD